MKRSTMALAGLSLIALPLAGCVTDGYGYGGSVAWTDAPYDMYYDNYYGPIYDGYWGGDGYFYYRTSVTDRRYHRGDHNHFRHDQGNGNWHRYQGTTHQPPHGTRMPHWTGHRGGNGGGGHYRGHR
jgi:hypothetical protein